MWAKDVPAAVDACPCSFAHSPFRRCMTSATSMRSSRCASSDGWMDKTRGTGMASVLFPSVRLSVCVQRYRDVVQSFVQQQETGGCVGGQAPRCDAMRVYVCACVHGAPMVDQELVRNLLRCVECRREKATVFCDKSEDLLCQRCYEATHSKGHRSQQYITQVGQRRSLDVSVCVVWWKGVCLCVFVCRLSLRCVLSVGSRWRCSTAPAAGTASAGTASSCCT